MDTKISIEGMNEGGRSREVLRAWDELESSLRDFDLKLWDGKPT